MGLEWMLKPSTASQITSSSQLDNLQENHFEEVYFALCNSGINFYILFECLNLCRVGQERNIRNKHRILDPEKSRCINFYHPCTLFFASLEWMFLPSLTFLSHILTPCCSKNKISNIILALQSSSGYVKKKQVFSQLLHQSNRIYQNRGLPSHLYCPS